MTTAWLWDTRYAFHDTGYGAAYLPVGGPIQPGLPFAENPVTKTRFRDLVEATPQVWDPLLKLRPRPATDEELQRLHPPDYVEHVRAVDAAGGGELSEGDTTRIAPGSFEIAVLAAGGALVATEAVMQGVADNGYALVRPPGHHAEAGWGRGFCVFSNTALAALHARHALGARRVAIVDWDVHHGNGTEAAFYEDPSVLAISLHADQLYPMERGAVTDNGRGAGEGASINIPLPDGSGAGAYLAAMERVVMPALERFRPDLILVASGLDASVLDPLGRQLLLSTAYREMTLMLMDAAARLCSGRLLCIHEGGYSEAYVPFCGIAIVEALLGLDPVVIDPFLPLERDRPAQELQPHQDAAVAAAQALVPGVPDHRAAA
jgi:acetoin utilization deacetylase AcuC-like enzyme